MQTSRCCSPFRGSVAFSMDRQKIKSLPLDGRTFVPLIALAPGVMLPPGSTLARINGSRPRVSEYMQPEPGQVAFSPIVNAIKSPLPDWRWLGTRRRTCRMPYQITMHGSVMFRSQTVSIVD